MRTPFLMINRSWYMPGRASKLRNADCGLRIEKENPKNPKSAIRNPKFNGPMLFEPQALPPGPQPRLPENVKLYESPARIGDFPI
jgi:hypothetical protein